MKKRSIILLFLVIVFLLPAMAWSLFNVYEKKFETLPVMGKTKDHRIGDFALINQEGVIRRKADWNRKIIVADFFFTHCPVICPTMTKSMKRVAEQYRKDTSIRFASFTVDPVRDSSVQLKKYAERFGINNQQWDLLTGGKPELYQLARNSFMIVATDGDGGPTDFIHSEQLVLIDRQQRIRGYYDGTDNQEVDKLLGDIKKLQHED